MKKPKLDWIPFDCDNPPCEHTTEIFYAKNFKEVAPAKYMEVEENKDGE